MTRKPDVPYVLRSVEARDLRALLRLSASAGVGLTTLPQDEGVLRGRIGDSRRGFERMAEKPGGETYLFVLEDSGRAARGGHIGHRFQGGRL